MIKRTVDILGGVVALLCALPLLPLIALAIRLDTPGPALYRQERIGRGLRPFTCYKFRTMTVETDARKNDGITGGAKAARITRVGHVLRGARLDELPQFWNILIGDMSLVGPRPQIPKYIPIYPDTYARLTAVRPGMTGLATVRFHRKEEDALAAADDPERVYIDELLPKKFRYDLFYVQHQSLGFDCLILWWTLKAVLTRLAG